MPATIYIKHDGDDDLTPEQGELFTKYLDQARVWARLIKQASPLSEEERVELYRQYEDTALRWAGNLDESDVMAALRRAVQTYDPANAAGAKFETYLYEVIRNARINASKEEKRYKEETGGGELSMSQPITGPSGEEFELEQLLADVGEMRVRNTVAYKLLREKIKKVLSDKEFDVYKLFAEEGFSNPEVAAALKLSPSRISGIWKEILKKLIDLPEIKEEASEEDLARLKERLEKDKPVGEKGSVQKALDEQKRLKEEEQKAQSASSLRHFLYRVGDKVNVISIAKTGSIVQVYEKGVYGVKLDYNGNTVRTRKKDLEKYADIHQSGQAVLDHYLAATVRVPRCYVSLASIDKKQHLMILEIRPISDIECVARLYSDNDLLGLAKVTEEKTDALFSLLRSYIGVNARLTPPFIALD